MSDITLAASADAFGQLFTEVRDNFSYSDSGSASWSLFSASYAVALHLRDGAVALHDDDTVEITGLQIVWDTLEFSVGLNLPGWCVGGFCIVPDPWNGCLVSFPGFCIGGPITVPIDLSGLVSDVSQVTASVTPRYYLDPARLASWTDLDALLAGHPNKWQIFLNPARVDLDPIDLPASLPGLFENLVEQAIKDLIPSWVPDWAVDILWSIIGPIADLIGDLLGDIGNIVDLLEQLIGGAVPDGFDILADVETAIAQYLAGKYPLWQFNDPTEIDKGGAGLVPIPILIPIRNLAVSIDSSEMTVAADVGA